MNKIIASLCKNRLNKLTNESDLKSAQKCPFPLHQVCVCPSHPHPLKMWLCSEGYTSFISAWDAARKMSLISMICNTSDILVHYSLLSFQLTHYDIEKQNTNKKKPKSHLHHLYNKLYLCMRFKNWKVLQHLITMLVSTIIPANKG